MTVEEEDLWLMPQVFTDVRNSKAGKNYCYHWKRILTEKGRRYLVPVAVAIRL